MLDDERRAWTDISILLPAASWQAYAALSRERREALERRFWWLADPLYLHPMNDRRTEHLARVMMSRLQEDAASGFAVTWGTDLEEITLRYGWPSGWVKVPKPRDRWVVMACYPDHARRFVPPPQYMPEPSLIPGPLPTNPWPLNPPVARTIYTPGYAIFRDLEHQLAVFQRGDSVEVVAAFDQTADPAWGQAMAEAAVFLVFDELTAPDVARATVRGSRGVLRLRVPASPRLLSFELYSEQREQAARARYGLRLRQVPRGLFALSSLLVTSPTKPLPTSLSQAARLARGSLRVRPGERLGLYWEVYGISLQPERLQVSVVVYKLGPDGRAITGSSEAPIHLRWRETLPALATPWPRSLTLDLPADLSPGNYIVLLHVMPHRHESVRTARMVLVED